MEEVLDRLEAIEHKLTELEEKIDLLNRGLSMILPDSIDLDKPIDVPF